MKSLKQLFERNSTGAVLIKYASMTALVDFRKSSFSYDIPVFHIVMKYSLHCRMYTSTNSK